MTAQALAVLFNPTLLRSPLNDFGVLMHNMNHTSQLLQTLIIHVSSLYTVSVRYVPDPESQFHRVFDETEADVDQDDEPDSDVDENVVKLDRSESRSSSVPTDAIHDHDPDLEPLTSLQTSERETLFLDTALS
jgi:hypothetical protein